MLRGTVAEGLSRFWDRLSEQQVSLSSVLAVPLAVLGVFLLDVWFLGAAACGLSSVYAKLVHREPYPGFFWHLVHPGASLRMVLLGALGAAAGAAVRAAYRTWLVLNVMAGVAALACWCAYRHRKAAAGELGTASFIDVRSARGRKYLALGIRPGVLFGCTGMAQAPVVLKSDAPGNRNVAVFGPPGTMKSAGYIRNNMFQAVVSGHSVVVTDPKGELARDFAPWFEKRGYEVRVFNLVSPVNSDRWNPLVEVHDDFSAQLFANIIISTTVVPVMKTGYEFWTNAELNLLKALVLYVVNDLPPVNRTIGTLYRLLSSGDIKGLTETMRGLPDGHPAKLPYNLFADTSENVKSGVVMGLGNRLSVFQNEVIDALTSVSDGTGIDVGRPGEAKCAYFCVLPDTDSAFDFIASLYFTFMFVKLVRQADMRPDGRLAVPVNFLLDEFCNISKIPDFTKKLSTMRGRGISCSIVFQSLPQLKSAYPQDGWQTILANCDYWLVLGANDVETASYVSRSIGATTVEVESVSHPRRLLPDFWDVRVNVGKQRRDLLDPSEVLRLDRDECLVKLESGDVVKLKKMHYSRHRYYSELEPRPLTEYTPAWSEQFRRRPSGGGSGPVSAGAAAVRSAPAGATSGGPAPAAAGVQQQQSSWAAAPVGGSAGSSFFGGSFAPPPPGGGGQQQAS